MSCLELQAAAWRHGGAQSCLGRHSSVAAYHTTIIGDSVHETQDRIPVSDTNHMLSRSPAHYVSHFDTSPARLALTHLATTSLDNPPCRPSPSTKQTPS